MRRVGLAGIGCGCHCLRWVVDLCVVGRPGKLAVGLGDVGLFLHCFIVERVAVYDRCEGSGERGG